jgi:acetylornithine deacetylase/succinyl-diaminopimelate desuccinylase-like protein
MTNVLAEIDQYIERHTPEFLEDLKHLCRIPSVSCRGEGIEPAAEMVAEQLTNIGLQAQILPSAGSPVVYADSGAGASTTVLCYNHYDVQPPEPLELWDSPPFEPTERNGRLYARGVADDKAHITSRLAAIQAIKAVTGTLPVRVKFLVEGDEESGSHGLALFVAEHRDLLAANVCVWEAGGVDAEGHPWMYLGLRGYCGVEFRVHTANSDAHSGELFNLPNAAWRMVWALASIKGLDERVRIPGFYDNVQPPTEAQVRLLKQLLSTDEDFARQWYGVKEFVCGRTGLAYQAAVFEPTATVSGFKAGWQGEGLQNIIPSVAMAKMDFRLVPGQDPEDVFRKLRQHLDAQGFSDLETIYIVGESAAVTQPDNPFVQLAVRTAEEIYGKPAVLYPLVGGSGPMHPFVHVLHTPIVCQGIGDPECEGHAPNESMSLEQFTLGVRHMARFLLACGS